MVPWARPDHQVNRSSSMRIPEIGFDQRSQSAGKSGKAKTARIQSAASKIIRKTNSAKASPATLRPVRGLRPWRVNSNGGVKALRSSCLSRGYARTLTRDAESQKGQASPPGAAGAASRAKDRAPSLGVRCWRGPGFHQCVVGANGHAGCRFYPVDEIPLGHASGGHREDVFAIFQHACAKDHALHYKALIAPDKKIRAGGFGPKRPGADPDWGNLRIAKDRHRPKTPYPEDPGDVAHCRDDPITRCSMAISPRAV